MDTEFINRVKKCKHEWQRRGRERYCPKCKAILDSMFGACLKEATKGRVGR